MQAGLRVLCTGGGASLCCLLLLGLIYTHLLKEGKYNAEDFPHLFISLMTRSDEGFIFCGEMLKGFSLREVRSERFSIGASDHLYRGYIHTAEVRFDPNSRSDKTVFFIRVAEIPYY